MSKPVEIVQRDGQIRRTRSQSLVKCLIDGGHAVRVTDRRIVMVGCGLYELRIAQSGSGGPVVMQRRPVGDRRKVG